MIKNLKQQRLNGLLDVLYKDKIIDTEKMTNVIEYADVLKINKKKYRNLKINFLLEKLKTVLQDMELIIDEYKILKNRTEFWENKSTYDFNFEDWNKIRKVNGHLTRYYNDLKTIKNNIMKGVKDDIKE